MTTPIKNLIINPDFKWATIFEVKKTTEGSYVSALKIDISFNSDNWLESFRLTPNLTMNFGFKTNFDYLDIVSIFNELHSLKNPFPEGTRGTLPLDDLVKFSERLTAWKSIRKQLIDYLRIDINEFGLNKFTTIDYLNLQSLGILSYQKILAEIYETKPLTIRDRIAYARRQNWLLPTSHGDRKSYITEIVNHEYS